MTHNLRVTAYITFEGSFIWMSEFHMLLKSRSIWTGHVTKLTLHIVNYKRKKWKKNTVSIFNHYFENWYVGFPLLWYTRISKFQFDQGYVRQSTINWMCYGNYRIITCFYLLRYFCYIPWCRMWSRNMRSEPQCFKQCEHWKLSSSRKKNNIALYYHIMSCDLTLSFFQFYFALGYFSEY